MRQTLSGLPDEVLSIILEGIFLDVVQLWMAGDATLNARIARSCRSVRSAPETVSKYLITWPRIFAQFTALRTLDIAVLRVHEPLAIVAAEIQKLPSRLSELSLAFENANMIPFFGPTLSNAVHSPEFLNHRLHDKEASSNASDTSWWTSNTFPLLTKAKFWDTRPFPLYPSVNLGALPMHLVSLSWSVKPIINTTCLLTGLPRSILSLEFGPFQIDAPTASSLPPNLTHLKGALCNDFKVVSSLPASLETGNWLGAVLGDLTPSAFSGMPPNTKVIKAYRSIAQNDFDEINRPWTDALPRHLVKLLVLPTVPLIASFIAALPRTLISISNMALDLQEIHQSVVVDKRYVLDEMWPPHLRTFSPDYSTRVHPQYFGLLPRTLTKVIRLNITPEVPVEPFLHTLPPHLIKFSARNTSYGVNWKLTRPMPMSLTLMDLTQTFTPEFLPSCFRFLPPQLVILKLGESRVDTLENVPFVADLPRGIKLLELSSFHADALAFLPPSLTTLASKSIHGTLTEDQGSLIPPSLTRYIVSAYGIPHLNTRNPGPDWLQKIIDIEIDDL